MSGVKVNCWAKKSLTKVFNILYSVVIKYILNSSVQ